MDIPVVSPTITNNERRRSLPRLVLSSDNSAGGQQSHQQPHVFATPMPADGAGTAKPATSPRTIPR